MPPLSDGKLIWGSGLGVFRLYWRRSWCVIDLVALPNSAETFSRFSLQSCKVREPGHGRFVTTVGLRHMGRKGSRHGGLLFK